MNLVLKLWILIKILFNLASFIRHLFVVKSTKMFSNWSLVDLMQISHANQRILADIKENVGHFREITENNILIERMAGRTNETYKVSLNNSSAEPVIYRKFGESESSNWYFLFRHVLGQRNWKSHIRACLRRITGPQDSLLHRRSHPHWGIHWV